MDEYKKWLEGEIQKLEEQDIQNVQIHFQVVGALTGLRAALAKFNELPTSPPEATGGGV